MQVNIQSHNLAKRKKCIPVPAPRKASGENNEPTVSEQTEPLLQEYRAVPVPKVQTAAQREGYKEET